MIQDAIREAEKRHREVQEATYCDSFSVYEYKKKRNETTKLMESGEESVFEDIPCRLSIQSVTAAQTEGDVASVTQTIKLFCVPELVIRPGSKLVIIRQGILMEYGYSGIAAVYASHQEIALETFRGWA